MSIKTILRCFQLGFCLRVNFYKSKIGVIGVDRNVVNMYSEILHCNLMDLHLPTLVFLLEVIHLGVPFESMYY